MKPRLTKILDQILIEQNLGFMLLEMDMTDDEKADLILWWQKP